MKKMLNVLILFIVSLLATSMAFAAVEITEVKLDGDTLSDSESATNFVRALEKGDEFKVKVSVKSDTGDVDDVQVEAQIRGYDHDDRVEDITDTFDMKNGTTYVKKLDLNFPERLDQDRYKLRVQVEDRNSATVEKTYELEIESPRHLLRIQDVIFSPETRVKAGRALLATVRVENLGQKDEDSVKVKVSIPELGVSASDFIDEVEEEGNDDDTVSSEELFMRIPECAEEGTYEVDILVEYDDGDERVTATRSIDVVSDGFCDPSAPTTTQKDKGKVVIATGETLQDVTAGRGGVVYPLTITNGGLSSRTFTVGVSGAENFGSSRVSPSNLLVVGSGDTQSVFVSVSADEDAIAGAHMFSVSVSVDGKKLKDVPFTANVVSEGSNLGNLRTGLEIGLVVLVIVLVILGLVIGFSKMRNEDEGGETYY